MLGQVRQPCLELQRKVPGGWRSVLLSGLLSLARTNKSRRLGERRKATTGVSLKMLCKRSVESRMGCFLWRISRMLGRAGLYVTMNGTLVGLGVSWLCSWKWNEKLDSFIAYLNNIHPTIKFTSERSTTSIPFLDVNIQLHNGKIETDLYCKPTDKHQYLLYSSSHPFHTKKSIPSFSLMQLSLWNTTFHWLVWSAWSVNFSFCSTTAGYVEPNKLPGFTQQKITMS